MNASTNLLVSVLFYQRDSLQHLSQQGCLDEQVKANTEQSKHIVCCSVN